VQRSRDNSTSAPFIRSKETALHAPHPASFALHTEMTKSHERGVYLISDVLPFGRLCYGDTNAVANAVGYAEHFSRSHDAVICVYDAVGNVVEVHKHKGDFKDWSVFTRTAPHFALKPGRFRQTVHLFYQREHETDRLW
jgi:hypothetical protein